MSFAVSATSSRQGGYVHKECGRLVQDRQLTGPASMQPSPACQLLQPGPITSFGLHTWV